MGEDSALPGRWSPYAVRLAEGGEPGALDAVREGRAGVQDEGSQLVALALAERARSRGPTARWLDGCAGPGGKAALLAALAAQRGAALLAAEKQPHRARLVARALEGNPGPYQVIAADGTRPPWRPGSLRPGPGGRAVHRARRAAPPARGPLAAPPRGPGRASPRSSAGCCAQALAAVRVGGVVGYATCSPHPAETRAVVDDVLKGRGGEPAQAELDRRPAR